MAVFIHFCIAVARINDKTAQESYKENTLLFFQDKEKKQKKNQSTLFLNILNLLNGIAAPQAHSFGKNDNTKGKSVSFSIEPIKHTVTTKAAFNLHGANQLWSLPEISVAFCRNYNPHVWEDSLSLFSVSSIIFSLFKLSLQESLCISLVLSLYRQRKYRYKYKFCEVD